MKDKRKEAFLSGTTATRPTFMVLSPRHLRKTFVRSKKLCKTYAKTVSICIKFAKSSARLRQRGSPWRIHMIGYKNGAGENDQMWCRIKTLLCVCAFVIFPPQKTLKDPQVIAKDPQKKPCCPLGLTGHRFGRAAAALWRASEDPWRPSEDPWGTSEDPWGTSEDPWGSSEDPWSFYSVFFGPLFECPRH